MDPYEEALIDRIRDLWRYRAWWRAHSWAEWPLRRWETDHELRALVRLARGVRRKQRERYARLGLGDHFAGVGR